jgi:hypothetical protein
MAVPGSACPEPKVSTAATKSCCSVAPGATAFGLLSSSTRPGPDWPDGTVTAAVPWFVTETRV